MRFACDSCGAQYMIADEKVGARGVKVKCKKCGNMIVVKPAVEAAAAAPAAVAAASSSSSGSSASAGTSSFDFGAQTAVMPQAQQNELAANRALKMAELVQQDKQFGTRESNTMKLGELDAKSRAEVARIGADARGMDPRMFQSFSEIQALNNENQNKIRYAKQLSEARKAALLEREKIKANKGWFDFGQPNDPRWAELNSLITNLDTEATKLGLAQSPEGGYLVPDFTPIASPVYPGMRTPSVALPTSPAPEITPAPVAQAQVPAMLQGGGVTMGGVPLGDFIDATPAAPTPTANRFRWTPNGVVAY